MKKRQIRGPFDRVPCDFLPEGESMTKQSFMTDCDVNNIMKRFERTGVIEHVNKFNGDYGDFTDLPSDYHEAMNQVREADEMFLTLPAKVRETFANDPGRFLAMVTAAEMGDEVARETMYETGILKRPPIPMERQGDIPPEPTKSEDRPSERKSPEGP